MKSKFKLCLSGLFVLLFLLIAGCQTVQSGSSYPQRDSHSGHSH